LISRNASAKRPLMFVLFNRPDFHRTRGPVHALQLSLQG
jgi:hypothetical protein